MSATLVWLRLDLRLDDNPALRFAVDRRTPVVPVYIHSPEEEAPWAPGAASRWWLHHSLERLGESVREKGGALVLRRGESLRELLECARAVGADTVMWNRRYEPAARARDEKVQRGLEAVGIKVVTFNSALLFEPWEVQTGACKPFQVYTAFWKKCLTLPEPPEPVGAPRSLALPSRRLHSVSLSSLELLPKIPWAAGLAAAWEPGEKGGTRLVREFFADGVQHYAIGRDHPAKPGASRLSPHLHFGEVSVRRIFHRAREIPRAGLFLKELGWREFAHHLLFHFPDTPETPLREAFRSFPWKRSAKHRKAWRTGTTGYPIVDAGMRQLWQTGWMHNRVRMIAGSFLIKDLGISWTEGARWFWDTLVDADLANNTLNWQWVAGCGADAAPFFRIFNPVLQGEKFDPEGEYVRRYVPELGRLPSKWIHRPWQSPGGKGYPPPIVDHAEARLEALAAYQEARRSSLNMD